MEKMRGGGHKLLLRRFRLDTGRKFFTMRKASHWNNLLRVVVESPALDTFNSSGLGAGTSILGHAFPRKVGSDDP